MCDSKKPAKLNKLINFFEKKEDPPLQKGTPKEIPKQSSLQSPQKELVENYFCSDTSKNQTNQQQSAKIEHKIEKEETCKQLQQPQESEIIFKEAKEIQKCTSECSTQDYQTEQIEKCEPTKEKECNVGTEVEIIDLGIEEYHKEEGIEFIEDYLPQTEKVEQCDIKEIDQDVCSKVEVECKQEIPEQEEEYTISYEALPNHLKGCTTPAVKSCAYFDASVDAAALKKAVKGLGTDESKIISVITNRSSHQRLLIAQAYEKLFQKNLVHELTKELSGDFEAVIVGLMTPKYEFLSKELRRSVKGPGTDEDALIEILCSLDDEDIKHITECYERLFKRTLKDDVYDDTSGDFRKILLAILSAPRSDPKASPRSVMNQICKQNECEEVVVDSEMLRTVIVSYTRPFLYVLFLEYDRLYVNAFENLIKDCFKGDAEKALLAIYHSIVSLPNFFAEQLQAAFKGLGTKESKLTRIIVVRSEIDLTDIKESYFNLFVKCLEKEVQKETSGDYGKAILSILRGCNQEESEEQPYDQHDLTESKM